MGQYAPPPGASDVLGLEVAGTVVARGEGAVRHAEARWSRPSSPAAATPTIASPPNRTRCRSPRAHAGRGRARPETYFTVWTNVFDRGALKAGETFLVHGGSSGIGTTAIQLAKAFGASVIATAGADDKVAECRKLGADVGINYRTEDFVEKTLAATGGKGADVILDMVGGDYVSRNYAAAAMDGRIVQIAFLRGRNAEIDLMPLMQKRLVHTGSTLRPRSPGEKAVIAEALRAKVWPLIEAGRCKPLINSVFPLAEAGRAHARMDGGEHVGKIVLTT